MKCTTHPERAKVADFDQNARPTSPEYALWRDDDEANALSGRNYLHLRGPGASDHHLGSAARCPTITRVADRARHAHGPDLARRRRFFMLYSRNSVGRQNC